MNNEAVDPQSGGELELRIFRSMIGAVMLAVLGSAVLAPWRVTAGLLLGGLLSLLNHHWLRTSIAAVLNADEAAVRRPRVKVSRFILRYFVIGGLVFAAYKLGFVSLTATIVGLCSFVVGLLIEALRQFYFAIFRREESY